MPAVKLENPTTTFILLKAHEPSDPPSITDAGSQAGQAFNQVLRYIAGCTGFQSQLFGWPYQPEADEVDTHDFVASIMPGTLAIFTNWSEARSAAIFLTEASLKQAFQGFTTFFHCPSAATCDLSEIDFSRGPFAITIAWNRAEALQILDRTRTPLRISLQHIGPSPDSGSTNGSVDLKDSCTDEASGILLGLGAGRSVSFTVQSLPDTSPSMLSLTSNDQEMCLSLMRTRYCSRIKQDLNEMIRSRRVD